MDRTGQPVQPDLFAETPGEVASASTGTTGTWRKLRELSPNAWDDVLHAWMSELPIRGEILQFARRVIAAAAAEPPGTGAEREAAEKARTDRGDEAVRTVLAASYQVGHEIDRLRGFLRFSPDTQGVYIARCEPDHFVLPALGEHFHRRFGEEPWMIIDEKRRLCLICRRDGTPGLFSLNGPSSTGKPSGAAADPWEDLWKNYHRAINNEGRKNLKLQRQLMPARYWKYLPEVGGNT